MKNQNLHNAKNAKNDEFYTQYQDIQKEVSAYLEYDINIFRDKTVLLPCNDFESNFTKFFIDNFNTFGLKKLISTSYSKNSEQLDLFESDIAGNGKVLILTKTENIVKTLDGNGDFRSEEVKKLRDESDFIITNPPFSLFREFIKWILEANKKFLIIGNMNAIAYSQIFPLFQQNRIWLGNCFTEDMVFEVPRETYIDPKDRKKAEKLGYKGNYTRLGNSCWFTNIELCRMFTPLKLNTMEENIKNNSKIINSKTAYRKYDNYDGIEVPFISAIPSDYDGVMGVPITFLSKHCLNQFKIVRFRKGTDNKDLMIDGNDVYTRILIRRI